jgi:chemotaxis protein histidine kinase CheA
LSKETFSVLRQLGQLIRVWEREIINPESNFKPGPEIQNVSENAEIFLMQIDAQTPGEGAVSGAVAIDDLTAMFEPTEQPSDVLNKLDAALDQLQTLLQDWSIDLGSQRKVAAVAQAFKSLRALSDGNKLADVTEVAWAIENMLDRLVDGTLKARGDFHAVSSSALNFFSTLSDRLSEIGGGEGASSFIDDYIYSEIIESADILASGGDLTSKNDEFEADFPSDSAIQRPPTIFGADTSGSISGDNGITDQALTLEETIRVFEASIEALKESLGRLETADGGVYAADREEEITLAAELRDKSADAMAVAIKLRGQLTKKLI